MTFDNHRLTVQTTALLQETSESRARIQAAADDERRRIEADLHDGAQQRLVALRIRVELAAERLADGNGHAEMLRGLGQEVEEALDELRSLARGIYPAPLGRGLTEALQSAALQSALHTTVHATRVGRYSREIETAAYFCCLEAMQNAAKHAHGATAIAIELFDNGSALLFEVRDDGAGFDLVAVDRGMGLTSMRDRIAAVGGQLEIDSSPGSGTRVTATIPVPASAGALV
jgi:signal transduction histidine kinase